MSSRVLYSRVGSGWRDVQIKVHTPLLIAEVTPFSFLTAHHKFRSRLHQPVGQRGKMKPETDQYPALPPPPPPLQTLSLSHSTSNGKTFRPTASLACSSSGAEAVSEEERGETPPGKRPLSQGVVVI